ncbi:MAG: 23S rRNA (uracil(1939)-C(5))-methyltransferase RlmD [Eubacteriales bacterium]|nr:23S rRNA (uracil(1939)-C(5))-methyltransferase RlmD [Eubacteriales bacterium]
MQINNIGGSKQTETICKAAKKCGGCQFQGIPYKEQVKKKQKLEEKLLGKFCKVNPIIGMENPYHYRNKVHSAFGRDRKGNIISGTYQAGTHNIIPVEDCLIEDEKSQEIIRTIRGMLKSFKIKTYDEDTGYGLLRHVMVRRGFQTGEIMVVLVLGSPILPSKNNFVKALRRVHPEITTVVLNINDKRTSMVLGERENIIYGPGFIKDRLCGCTFRISPKSFYQVNPVQTEILYSTAIRLAKLTGRETVIDAYCGIGTISLVAAAHAGKVIGVELNKDAVRDARINAKENKSTNVEFHQGDAGAFMASMADNGQHADVVFMDPPRSGSDEKFLAAVTKLAPDRIIYISCGPESLARDLKYLTRHHYMVRTIQPVEMFPFTEHIESIVLLQKSNRKPDTYVKLNLDMEDYYRIKDQEK